MYTQTLLSVAAVASTALAVPHLRARADPQCPIVFDGRVPIGTDPTSFDTYATATLYNPDYTKNLDVKWSDILKFPNTTSRFDGDEYTSLEVTLSDKSIFMNQNGFRRAGLQFLQDSGDGEGAKGVKTLHWSVKQDPARPMNLTHEYLNVWHETSSYDANQFQFQAGSIIGKPNSDKDSFKILDRYGSQYYSVPINMQEWQNFAIKLDYNRNQAAIYYSLGAAPLELVVPERYINLAGGGQYQLGMLKKPTGTSDVVNSGYQEPNLDEGQIYGGIFLEDSADGCVSL